METLFFVEQPPLVEKFRLLVDEMSDKRNYGYTVNIHKIQYNLGLLGEDFRIDLSIKNLLVDAGTTAVFPLGRFITILQIRKDEEVGKMSFFDFDVDAEKMELRTVLEAQYSDNIVNAWFQVYQQFPTCFLEEDDKFELYIP